jgi:hypothetical protein
MFSRLKSRLLPLLTFVKNDQVEVAAAVNAAVERASTRTRSTLDVTPVPIRQSF